jgi:hypothetical protein
MFLIGDLENDFLSGVLRATPKIYIFAFYLDLFMIIYSWYYCFLRRDSILSKDFFFFIIYDFEKRSVLECLFLGVSGLLIFSASFFGISKWIIYLWIDLDFSFDFLEFLIFYIKIRFWALLMLEIKLIFLFGSMRFSLKFISFSTIFFISLKFYMSDLKWLVFCLLSCSSKRY